MTEISLILPTRNPHAGRLRRTLEGLASQTLDHCLWEILIVDNGSEPAIDLPPLISGLILPALRCVRESEPGLTAARLRGVADSHGSILVFADDDNVLCPGYLAAMREIFSEHPSLGIAGGEIQPEWEISPPLWTKEFHSLLALHNYGPIPLIAKGGKDARWPDFAPVGAGLGIRRAATTAYTAALRANPSRRQFDRRGSSLRSGGDNDFVFTALHAGWDLGYFPVLSLIHLIPANRIQPGYLATLNEEIQRSWVQVLDTHHQCPWPAIARWTVPLRSARAWCRGQAWRSPGNYVRWRGLHGRFRGQAELSTSPRR